MADYLLDTTYLSILVTADHPVRNRILRHARMTDSFAVPVPALTEFLFGIQIAVRAKQNFSEWTKLQPVFLFCEMDRTVAEDAARLQISLRQHGWQLGTVDALIAAVALQQDLTLLTTDRDFSMIPGLRTENWIQYS